VSTLQAAEPTRNEHGTRRMAALDGLRRWRWAPSHLHRVCREDVLRLAHALCDEAACQGLSHLARANEADALVSHGWMLEVGWTAAREADGSAGGCEKARQGGGGGLGAVRCMHWFRRLPIQSRLNQAMRNGFSIGALALRDRSEFRRANLNNMPKGGINCY
jgi:hypothetical protein